MKQIISIISLLMVLFSASGQGEGKSTTVVFDDYTWDFGKINEMDGPVYHVFKFKNTGSVPFVITNVSVSCGCTTPEYKRTPVATGVSGEIKVTYDPKDRPGAFEKVIYILSNDTRREIRLVIKGDVVPRPKTVEDDFPINLGQGLRASAANVFFGNIARGKKHSQAVSLINTGTKPVTIGVSGTTLPSYISTDIAPKIIDPNGRGTLTISIDASKIDIWGQYIYEIPLTVNGVIASIELKIMAVFVEDFGLLSAAERANPPSLQISSYFYHFSNVKQGDKLEREFKISNTGGSDLIIRHVQSKDGKIKYRIDKTVIKSGDTATLTLTLPTIGESGRLSDAAIIITNDPDRAIREIRLMVTVIDK